MEWHDGVNRSDYRDQYGFYDPTNECGEIEYYHPNSDDDPNDIAPNVSNCIAYINPIDYPNEFDWPESCGPHNSTPDGSEVDYVCGRDDVNIGYCSHGYPDSATRTTAHIGPGGTSSMYYACDDACFLENEDGDLISTGWIDQGEVTFWINFVLTKGEEWVLYVVVDVAGDVTDHSSLGFTIEKNNDIHTDRGTISLENIKPEEGNNEVSYINAVPSKVKIDGAFADWMMGTVAVKDDQDGDVNNENLDIVKYGAVNNSQGFGFYLRVDGEMMGGMSVGG